MQLAFYPNEINTLPMFYQKVNITAHIYYHVEVLSFYWFSPGLKGCPGYEIPVHDASEFVCIVTIGLLAPVLSALNLL